MAGDAGTHATPRRPAVIAMELADGARSLRTVTASVLPVSGKESLGWFHTSLTSPRQTDR